MEISKSLRSVLKEALDGLNNLIFTECSLLQDVRGGKEEKESRCTRRVLAHLLIHHRVPSPQMKSLNNEHPSHPSQVPLSHVHVRSFLFRRSSIAHLCSRGGSSSCCEPACWLELLASSYLLRQIGSVICNQSFLQACVLQAIGASSSSIPSGNQGKRASYKPSKNQKQ